MNKFSNFLESILTTDNEKVISAIASAYLVTHPEALNEGFSDTLRKMTMPVVMAGTMAGGAMVGNKISNDNIDKHTQSVIQDIKAIKEADKIGDKIAKDKAYSHLKPNLFRIDTETGSRVFVTHFGTFDSNGNPLK